MDSTQLPVKKGYAETSRGQVHYRACPDNAGAPPVVLLHWAPGTGRQYEHVLPALAAKGYAPYALDLMGFGRSDARQGHWSIDDFADNLREALAFLGLMPVSLIGGHFSAAVSAAFALRYPQHVTKLILDGSPCWDAPARKAIAAQVDLAPPAIDAEGSHTTLPWDRAVFALKDWDSSFEVSDGTLMDVYLMAIDVLEMRFDTPVQAIVDFDMQDVLRALQVPVLALCAEEERLRPQHDVVLTCVPHADGLVFPGQHPLVNPKRAEDYVDVVTAFLGA